MSTQHDNADTTRCAACVEARERLDDASADRARAWLRYRDASEAYRTDLASGALSLGSSECTQRWNEVNRLWHEAQARYTEWIAAQHEAAHTISEHSKHLQEAAGEAQDVPLAETEEMCTVATDTGDASASAHGDLDGDGEPLYLCGGFLNVQAERHATVERHEIEEDDVLRDAVRAIEHGETTRIRAWGFGNRQGRRTALRELRELLDDMIADIDDDNQQSQQTPAAGTPPQEPAETEDKSDATECDDHERGDLTLEGIAALVNSRLSEYEDGGKR